VKSHFAAYHSKYNAAIPVVVILPGFLTFLAGTVFYWTRPLDVPRRAAALVGAAGVTSLLSTVIWAIPMHDRLDQAGQSVDTINSLLHANLLRSLALTTGAVTLSWCVATSEQSSRPRRVRRSTTPGTVTASSKRSVTDRAS
jgi:hypothetical protein